MSTINKQKFLAELAKLLTFMYEEDRQRALAAYTEMFDEAEDEQLLLQALTSPLRQAVEVARAYNAGRPALEAAPKEKEEPHSDAFLDTIHRIRAEALSAQPVKAPVDADQISLFDPPEEEEEKESEPVAAEGEESEEAGTEAEAGSEPETEPESEEAEAEEESEEEPAPPVEAPAVPQPAPEEAPARLPVQKTLRKPRVLLLILYALIAVPLGLIGVVILLIPALTSLAAAAACIIVAVLAVTSALGSFPKIANLLVALGASLVLLAVGLVFLMLFVWFLGGAIGGLINGLITLGGKWCYKEVPAE